MKIRAVPDLFILLATVGLLGYGLMMVYSASAVLAFREFGSSSYYLQRQLIFAGLGIIGCYIAMNTDYRVWKKSATIGLLCCFALLILVLIPGIGVVRGGARSWLGIGSLGIQPSEFMKLAMVIYLSHRLSLYPEQMTHFVKGLMPVLGILGIAFGLIMLQPDLGTGAVLLGASLIVVFTAGAKLSHIFGLACIGLIGLIALIATAPYRLQRITAFMDPWSDPLGAGYQAIQSLFAIGPGGLIGLGYGASRQKHSYLPEPQTDFIFSIVAEELGFIGGATMLLLFFLLVWRGIRAALNAPDTFGSLLAVGIIGIITVQVFINIGVVIGLLPVTGITLPFISAGGSSLTLLLTSIGILLNISRHTP